MYFVYHKLTGVLIAKTTDTEVLNNYPPQTYKVIIY